jgi:hypothetical protein
MLIDKITDNYTGFNNFKVVRHKIHEGSRKYYGAGMLHHTVIVKAIGQTPFLTRVAVEISYILLIMVSPML